MPELGIDMLASCAGIGISAPVTDESSTHTHGSLHDGHSTTRIFCECLGQEKCT
jgi:hypothetical protein